MPPELADTDWDEHKPDGMTDLTYSYEYNQVWAALESGLTPGEFRLLPWDEQAELTAYLYVRNRIQVFQAHENRQEAERKQKEIESKAKSQGKRRG